MVYIFDLPRTNSQLFNKLFAAHPQLEQILMPMIAASLYGPEAMWRGRQMCKDAQETWPGLAEASGVQETETYDVAVKRMEAAVRDAREKVRCGTVRRQHRITNNWKGKIPWAKDHAINAVPRGVQDAWLTCEPLPEGLRQNATCFSTEFLDSVTPIFLIRHPALSMPSFYRKAKTISYNEVDEEVFRLTTTYFWSRAIFDSYVLRSKTGTASNGIYVTNGEPSHIRTPNEGSCTPIVIDAADVIYNTEATVAALCRRLQIDYDGVQLTWDPVPEAERPADLVMQHYLADLQNSRGIERRSDKPAEECMNLDKVQLGWATEFGEETAKSLRSLVDVEIPNYEYLYQFKLKA
ncbi:hypothetical protein LTR37_011884 [Vermiconidia calcicola]|uniref:Uncharacterized protein n=1 Tax=Vermiconidia calcicola TaxID=1690605 RepID=A0ACC3N255_9PEZI|nr:hypothetical protein LTR37_011884 [Vermiconidia calcicola]